MNDQEKAKAAVNAADSNRFYMFAELTAGIEMLRPIAAGKSVIVPVESLKKLHDQISIVGGDMRALETVSKMIAAAKEGE